MNFAMTVHPRLRGELLRKEPQSNTNSRFIPACAGNSVSLPPVSIIQTVHPRLRGELQKQIENGKVYGGSSPLARGTRKGSSIYIEGRRFIPACAGNSTSIFSFVPPPAVHPRLRGELLVIPVLNLMLIGSSPLARGTLYLRHLSISSYRFIPACAGNSKTALGIFEERAVHPRLRGELSFLNH